MIMRGFGDRLADAMAEHGPVCVGIDPHPGLLEQWGLDHSIDGFLWALLKRWEAELVHSNRSQPSSNVLDHTASAYWKKSLTPVEMRVPCASWMLNVVTLVQL